jgi:hypothetical protein
LTPINEEIGKNKNKRIKVDERLDKINFELNTMSAKLKELDTNQNKVLLRKMR